MINFMDHGFLEKPTHSYSNSPATKFEGSSLSSKKPPNGTYQEIS
jgi:hypothetical protein